jgi:branched-chain amino acid transport system substrate-binding protein
MNRPFHGRTRTAAAVVAAVALGALAGCSSSSSTPSASTATSAPAASAAATSPAPSSSSSASTVSTSSCGTKPGVAATGTPINIGAINTKQPGTDFSDIENMTAAYFACVNANGGINGHPIKYFPVTEQTNPSQIAALARQLVTTDHVVGMMGNSSIIECSVDAAYWKSVGIDVLGAGIDPECYSTPNTASVNMGPRYSSDGAVQYVLAQGASKIAFDQSNVPGTAYIAAGPNAVAKAKGAAIQDFTENVPITSANAIATKLVTAAGSSGAVVLNFLATTLGPKWNGKLFVNAELLPLDGNTSATAQLFDAILKQYGTNVSGGVGSFSEMGFTIGEIATHALEGITGPYTIASVSAALEGVKDYNTGMLCQGYTYGAYPEHIPNNMDYTVTPDNGKFVQASSGGGCTLISASDPQIASYRAIAGTAPMAS